MLLFIEHSKIYRITIWNRKLTVKAKFVTISEEIIEKIKSGELLPGDQIPSENALF